MRLYEETQLQIGTVWITPGGSIRTAFMEMRQGKLQRHVGGRSLERALVSSIVDALDEDYRRLADIYAWVLLIIYVIGSRSELAGGSLTVRQLRAVLDKNSI
ncbi:hypothetical protein SAMD00023353_8200170 [Rosellinia necatrix]|uniref:Uncharacterized protein n=1 Tax=Rosellinia necatrix TaxID=77044 RepID=A0A1S8AAQ6_ROSNE|nr:hypothetical protein SAMD00023353_8200170 [Rosellinia necatrix]